MQYITTFKVLDDFLCLSCSWFFTSISLILDNDSKMHKTKSVIQRKHPLWGNMNDSHNWLFFHKKNPTTTISMFGTNNFIVSRGKQWFILMLIMLFFFIHVKHKLTCIGLIFFLYILVYSTCSFREKNPLRKRPLEIRFSKWKLTLN